MKHQLIYPIFFYIFYTFCFLFLSFRKRMDALKKRELKISYFKTYNPEGVDEQVLIYGRHFDNQFQVPVLFFITSLLRMQVAPVQTFSIIIAWFFVLTRLIHSFFHLNGKVRARAISYLVGWISLLILWGDIFLHLN